MDRDVFQEPRVGVTGGLAVAVAGTNRFEDHSNSEFVAVTVVVTRNVGHSVDSHPDDFVVAFAVARAVRESVGAIAVLDEVVLCHVKSLAVKERFADGHALTDAVRFEVRVPFQVPYGHAILDAVGVRV